MNSLRTLSRLLLVVLLFPAAAMAQIHPPATTQPGQVQQHLRIEEARPPVGGDTIITVPDAAGKPKKLKGEATFTLKGIVFEHLTAFTPEDLRKEYDSYIGKEISLSTLHDIASKITVRYRNAGYILSRAVVPPQRIENGIAKIRIIEGFVNKVSIDGVPKDASLLSEYAEKIKSAKPLDAKTLERYLLLMQDLPGVSAQAVIRPAKGVAGASDVVVTITQKKIDGSVTVDNRGTRFMGPVQGGATVNFNNLFGVYDRTQFHGVMTPEINELRYGQIVHEEQLDSEGTKLSLAAGITRTHPVFTLAAFDLEGRDTLVSAQVSHPFLRTRQSNLFGTLSFEIHNTSVDTLGSQLYDDRLRVLRTGAAYDFVDMFSAVNKVEGAVSHGFSWGSNDATTASRAGGQTNFYKATAQVSRLQPITGPFDIYVAANGQISSDGLLTAEQFAVGGEAFGSAYDPSEITGDSGAAGRTELRYNRSGDFTWIPTYQFYGFYDLGKVWNRNAVAGQPTSTSLADGGLGLRFNAEAPLSGGLEFAAPLTRGVGSNGQEPDRARVFFSLAYRY